MGSSGGFTLAEAVLALVVLGMAAAGVLLPFAGGASAQAEGLDATLATSLASDLLERIIHTPADQVVATWHGYSEAAGQMKDANGAVLTDPMYADFGRDVGCYAVYVPQQSGMAESQNFVLISVHVHCRGRQIAVLHRLISI